MEEHNNYDTQRMIHEEYDGNPRGCFLLVLAVLLAFAAVCCLILFAS